MNEILRKRIEDFASEYAERMYKNSTDGERRAAKHDVIKGAEFILCRQWISVNEALPDDNEIALFIDQHGSMQLLTMSDIRKQNEIWDKILMGTPIDLFEESIVRLDKIVAWLPIPKFETKSNKHGVQ